MMTMLYDALFYVALTLSLPLVALGENAFDDSILFRMTWPGSHSTLTEPLSGESLLITTADDEKYQCTLPIDIQSKENDADKKYNGPSALELLFPLFTQLLCSYRLEQYWTYELCHGKYIKQYHDEKDVANSKKLNRQEYILGTYDLNEYAKQIIATKDKKHQLKHRNPTKRIGGTELPVFSVLMDDGTMCDLNGKPRLTNVLYVCYPESKHEIYSLEEVSTCEYEMVVLTPLLCAHPSYRQTETIENDIQCHSVEGSPRRPLQLENLDLEYVKNTRRKQKYKGNEKKSDSQTEELPKYQVDSSSVPNDAKLVKDFLTGDYCLFGGSGWWKFEFCYGKKVEQYHEERDSKKTIISLGMWNKEKHFKWLEQNPHKRPKKGLTQKQISHLYADGSMCDQTTVRRQVEVKFKCKESSNHPNAVSLYLLEPKTCEYILVVESSFICNLIDSADENGLFKAET